ncbi:MAG TPA: sensor histidine kinase [Alkalispirochaeta sp.]|nr:sensor histidine kinase [Alkalispirochaeta sp.]
MRRTGTTVPGETLQSDLTDDNVRRGRIASGVLGFWIIGSLVIDVVYYVPRGEHYYVYLDLIMLPIVAGFAMVMWKHQGSSIRTQTVVFLFSLIFLVWAAVLATFQETPYTLFIVAFFVSTVFLIPPKESVLIYTATFIAYAAALAVRAGSPLAHGTTIFIEVLAMTVTAGVVSVLLYRQRVQTLEAEQSLLRQNRLQEQEIANRTEDLNRRLREREVLLREIHHRVKNNLQILASLLKLSEHHGNGQDAETRIRGAEQRIASMAMVHQQLGHTDDFENVDLGRYLTDLGEYVVDEYHTGSEISLTLDLQSIVVSIDMAVNLGLLVTEVLSNAVQHAFDPEQSDRVVRLSAWRQDSELCLAVQDNGKGFCPDHLEHTVREGLGLVLIDSISTQLGAMMTYECANGTTCRFQIPFHRD